MTTRILKAWAVLIRKAAREGWPAERLDAEMGRVKLS